MNKDFWIGVAFCTVVVVNVNLFTRLMDKEINIRELSNAVRVEDKQEGQPEASVVCPVAPPCDCMCNFPETT